MRTTRADHKSLVEISRERRVPAPPARPGRGECCDRGCDPCVWDYYETSLSRWCERHGVERPTPAE